MPSKTRQPDDEKGPKGRTDWPALDAMTDEEVEAAARADPDCPPLSGDRRMLRMAIVKRIRLGLLLSPSDFAARFQIPLTTLMAWERHEAEPDAVATAFLRAIAADPEALARALSRSPDQPAAAE